jgi:hypothetical protein
MSILVSPEIVDRRVIPTTYTIENGALFNNFRVALGDPFIIISRNEATNQSWWGGSLKVVAHLSGARNEP